MKHLKIIVLTCLAAFALTSCFEDMDDNIIPGRDINDFVWKGMNAVYLYKSEIPNLDDGRFSSNEEYVNYLNDYSTPEELFESLKYSPSTVDRFSRIYSNYFDLQNQQAGTTLTDGLEYNLYLVPGSSTEVFGAITLVLENSTADNLGLQRGEIFRAVDGIELTVDNRIELLNQNSYTLNFADYNDNDTTTPIDDTITLNGNSASISKVAYTENPIHIAEVINVDNLNIGYLMYNGFNANFDTSLNDAFAQFNAAGVSELVLDLRYNGGGSVQTAAYLGSMVTGQYTGEVFSKLFFNDNLSSNNNTYTFTNSIPNGGAINSLNLNKVYVLTSNKRTASASELIINSLKPYIEVIVVGENTVGKTQASRVIYDSPDLSNNNVNPSHTYAMQPLIANSTNVNDELVPSTGMIPDIEISERPHTLGTLGDLNEPLLEAALAHMTGSGRPADSEFETYKYIDINMPIPAIEQDMYVE
ncbi:C-terminal processing protease CtpA/Prc [Winogradskyella epiphytica]|uniref:C-terminal processing protease CtpA/Prc n=1 Tax=Winogradskyella epiphytica TaxID=262005 RepID=A0A2V4YD26_9FLAO|nr:S41 family peptidase [Winogradskyella epiphytica]PYE81117.1 C-terminal processing protease CtpA/Prc [Winogradskyella epiphytica]GGW66978.1 peptidase S41 [Winogradskyella epiphytica]